MIKNKLSKSPEVFSIKRSILEPLPWLTLFPLHQKPSYFQTTIEILQSNNQRHGQLLQHMQKPFLSDLSTSRHTAKRTTPLQKEIKRKTKCIAFTRNAELKWKINTYSSKTSLLKHRATWKKKRGWDRSRSSAVLIKLKPLFCLLLYFHEGNEVQANISSFCCIWLCSVLYRGSLSTCIRGFSSLRLKNKHRKT